MGSIAGFSDFVSSVSADKPILSIMNEVLAHRGRDENGEWICDETALCANRLKITDLQNGTQPMEKTVGDRKYVIIYDGEIYNTKDRKSVV